MKKEIMGIVKSGNGTFRLNNFSCLRRWTKDAIGNKVDKLVVEFDNLNHVNFSNPNCSEIKSRDFDGIIEECCTATEEFFRSVSERLVINIKNGYTGL